MTPWLGSNPGMPYEGGLIESTPWMVKTRSDSDGEGNSIYTHDMILPRVRKHRILYTRLNVL